MDLIKQLKEDHKSINNWAIPLHYLLSTFLSKRKCIQPIHGSMLGEELLRNTILSTIRLLKIQKLLTEIMRMG